MVNPETEVIAVMSRQKRRQALAEAKQPLAEVRELAQAPRPDAGRVFFLLRIIWRSIEAGASVEELGVELAELCQLRRQAMPRPPAVVPFSRRIAKRLVRMAKAVRRWFWLRRLSSQEREFYDYGVSVIEHTTIIHFDDDYLLDVLGYELKHGLISEAEHVEAAKGRTRYFQKIDAGSRGR